MFRYAIFPLIALLPIENLSAQPNLRYIDSVRIASQIPELAYAVLSADSVLEQEVIGGPKFLSHQKAKLTHRFRIGSNTKTVTSYLAALLVKEGKLQWGTRFFDLYPELKALSFPAYHALTLKDLITFRAPLIKWTYTDELPRENDIKGNAVQQRYQFISWIFQQPPVLETRTVYWSNPAYVAAGMMLEKASGSTYEELVETFGNSLGMHLAFGQPNEKDTLQPWGHNEHLQPEKPASQPKLNWLSSAGNLQVSLPDYVKFIQLQLKGLAGQSALFTQKEFETFHYGLPDFAYGWKWLKDPDTELTYSFHDGNPGSFLSSVHICQNTGMAFIVFCNVQSPSAGNGLNQVLQHLKSVYRR